MDWSQMFGLALQQGLGPTAAVYCLAAIGLNIHFGYTGLLNFGQAGFMAVGRLRHGLDRLHVGAAVLARPRRRPRLAACCSPCCSASPRCGCAPTTWRSSRSPRPRSSGRWSGSVSLLEYFGGQDGLQQFTGVLRRTQPVLRTDRHRLGW